MKRTRKTQAALFCLRTLAFLLALSGFSACNSDVEDPKLPEVPSKLVLVSFISPEDPEIKVSVTRSVGLLSAENTGQPVLVKDAIVLFSDGKDTVQLPYFFSRSLYATTAIPVKPGQQYWLKVTSPQGLLAEATCTVPAKLNQSLSARIDSGQFDTEQNERLFFLELKWQDLPGEGDFYKTDAGQVINYITSPADTIYSNIEMLDESVVRDYQADGRSFTVRSYSYTQSSFNTQQQQRLLYLQTYLLTTDKPLYEYHRSLLRLRQVNNLTDPVKLYSNVKGGFGVFGAYRRFALKVPVR